MKKDINYYISRGFNKTMAEYFASGRKKIIKVFPTKNFELILEFNNGEKRVLNCKPFIKDNTVFEVLKDYNIFKRVYIDDSGSISWDKDPSIDSNIIWNNKIDICPDTSYTDSVPIETINNAG